MDLSDPKLRSSLANKIIKKAEAGVVLIVDGKEYLLSHDNALRMASTIYHKIVDYAKEAKNGTYNIDRIKLEKRKNRDIKEKSQNESIKGVLKMQEQTDHSTHSEPTKSISVPDWVGAVIQRSRFETKLNEKSITLMEGEETVGRVSLWQGKYWRVFVGHKSRAIKESSDLNQMVDELGV